MKYILRVPTKDQYAYLEASDDFESPEAATEAYRGIFAAVHGEKVGSGMEAKEWNRCIDLCMANKLSLTPDQWESMNPQQQWFLKEIKKSRNRKPLEDNDIS